MTLLILFFLIDLYFVPVLPVPPVPPVPVPPFPSFPPSELQRTGQVSAAPYEAVCGHPGSGLSENLVDILNQAMVNGEILKMKLHLPQP